MAKRELAQGFGDAARKVGEFGRRRSESGVALNRRNEPMEELALRRSGYRRMGGGAVAGGYVLNRRSSGSKGAPPIHSSGGHMLQ